jgi:hypothetical protein
MVQWKRIGRSFDRWVQVYVAIIATYGVYLSRSSSGLNVSKPTVNQSAIANTFGHLSTILTVPNVLIASGALLTLVNYLLKRREHKLIQVADPGALESQRIATDDGQRITERIHFEQPFKVEGTPQLTAVDPFIEFSVGVRNSSVLTLDVEREVEGRLRIDNTQELRQPLEIQKYPLAAIKHGDYRPMIFRQWLSAEAAAQIRHQRTTIFDAGFISLLFKAIGAGVNASPLGTSCPGIILHPMDGKH